MEITLYNIQGFRGHFQYTIDDLITIINSKHNGVGKTTLFDCLRFLVDESQVDKEERTFFLNLEEEEGVFSIKKDGVLHGFAMYKGRPHLFFRQVDGEEVETSPTNFPNVGQDIGVLHVNGSLLNIFSKEVNLFSSSDSAQNYKLVKEITTHQPTENMLSLIQESIEFNSQEMSQLRLLLREAMVKVESTPYYFAVDEAEKLLKDPFYEDFEDTLSAMLVCLTKIKEVPELNFNSDLEYFIATQESLDRLQATEFDVPNPEVLERVLEVVDLLDRLQPVEEVNLDIAPLENLISVSESLAQLVPSKVETHFNIEVLERLDLVADQLSKIEIVPEIQVSSNLPSQLSSVCIKLGEMITACNQEARFNKLVEDNRANVAGTRVQCPIREEVYLINGKCVY